MIREIRTRRSTRKFKDGTIDEETILQLLESARLAPSGNNTQPWRFVVVRERATRERIAKANGNQFWMADASVHIVCVADIRSRIPEGTPLSLDEQTGLRELKQIIRDTSIAAEHIVLEAESLGLASCWVAEFVQDDIRPLLGIPADKYVVCVLAIGYADSDGRAAPVVSRKPMNEIVRYEKW